MEIEIVAIGDEVLLGYTQNSNASFLSQMLLEAGFLPCRIQVVGDDPVAIKKVLKESLDRKSFVITTGGLGPTCDDLTRRIVSELYGIPLKYNPEVAEWIEEHFGKISTLADQAIVPLGAKLLPNSLGTASGFIIEDSKFEGAILAALPGVPQELHEMAKGQLLPYIKEKISLEKSYFVMPIHFAHLIEATCDPVLREIEAQDPEISCGIYPGYGKLTVHLKAKAASYNEFLSRVAKPKQLLETKFCDYVYESASGNIEDALHKLCIEKGLLLSCAESCTGGALSAKFTALPDSSLYFRGGVVAYSNDLKRDLLGVKEETLEKFGAVSCETTQEMARGILERAHTDISIGISGIFGPKGGTQEKPVGTVSATLLFRDRPPFSWQMFLKGNRELIREKTIEQVLSELLFFLRKNVAS
jgi:nicotinamide-nucleotide amidase